MSRTITIAAARLGPIARIENRASAIFAPSGEIVARCSGIEDELIVARCDLDLGRSYRETTFDFARHRRVETYGMIVERTGRNTP